MCGRSVVSVPSAGRAGVIACCEVLISPEIRVRSIGCCTRGKMPGRSKPKRAGFS